VELEGSTKPREQDPRTRRALRFIGERCVIGPNLVVPLRVLWREYERWADEQALPDPQPRDLKAALDAPWATVSEPKGRGRMRTVVHGVGFKG